MHLRASVYTISSILRRVYYIVCARVKKYSNTDTRFVLHTTYENGSDRAYNVNLSACTYCNIIAGVHAGNNNIIYCSSIYNI